MSHVSKPASNEGRPQRSFTEQTKALESILYELLMLGSALLLRDTRYFFKKYPRLLWGPPQIAHDVMRLKCRLLGDFFGSERNNVTPDDMICEDFANRVPFVVDRESLDRFRGFKAKVNKWTLHLSWIRTDQPEYTKSDREAMEEYAMILLRIGDQFIAECIAGGFVLEGWSAPYYAAFKKLYAHLAGTSRIEEGRDPVVKELIRLMELASRAQR